MKNDLLNLIKKAMLSKNKIELDTLRAIKTKFTEFENSKETPVLDYNGEVNILKKMFKERIETAEIYEANNRQDLADKERSEAEIIKQYLPKEVSKEEIEEFIDSLGNFTQKEMGVIISTVKNKFPGSDGKLISDIVKSKIN